MTVTAPRARVGTQAVRARFREPGRGDKLSLKECAQLLDDLHEFVRAGILTSSEAWTSHALHDFFGEARMVPPPPGIGPVEQYVRRLRYASPMEVLIGFTGSVTMVALATNRVIDVFDKFNNARVTYATANTKVLAQEVVQEQLKRELAGEPDTALAHRMNASARALENLAAVESVPDEEL